MDPAHVMVGSEVVYNYYWKWKQSLSSVEFSCRKKEEMRRQRFELPYDMLILCKIEAAMLSQKIMMAQPCQHLGIVIVLNGSYLANKTVSQRLPEILWLGYTVH